MTQDSVFTYKTDENGIASLIFNDPKEKVNKLSATTMQELNEILDNVSNDQTVKALVIKSTKKNIFIAGADISEIKSISDPKEGVLSFVYDI